MKRSKIPALLSAALLAAVSLQGCADPAPPTAERDEAPVTAEASIAQPMDGCGAQLYRDNAEISCAQVGTVQLNYGDPIASCLDEEHLSCNFRNVCSWSVVEVTTTCWEGSGACASILGNTPPNNPPPFQITLAQGNRLCVAGNSTQTDLERACAGNRSAGAAAAQQFCEAQFSEVSGTVSCCLSCISTPPPAQSGARAAATTTSPSPVCEGADDAARE